MAEDFYGSLPVVADFALALTPSAYRPLPSDWRVGFADVAGSTAAVAAGRYKAVNMIGAGVVAAVSNALQRRAFPFVFGGDGASFAVSAADAPAAEAALRAMATFALEEFGFELRIAMTGMSEIRAAGRDIRVARYGPSSHCAYAMFDGGGLRWLDGAAKEGRFVLDAAPPGTRPDLTDLSCRWGVTPAKHGLILSLIVAARGDDPRFAAFLEALVTDLMALEGGGRPITLATLIGGAPAAAISLEAKVYAAGGASNFASRAKAAAIFAVGFVFKTFKLKAGGFDMAQYQTDLIANADFRKFEDGLKATLDCSPAFADALEARLAATPFVEWGVSRQPGAQVTCYSPFSFERGHLHFVDGAGGGYTMAAKDLKARRGLLA